MHRSVRGCGNQYLDEVQISEQLKKHKDHLRQVKPNAGLIKMIREKPIQLNQQKSIQKHEDKLLEIE